MVESLSSLLLWSHIFIGIALLLWNTLFLVRPVGNVVGIRGSQLRVISGLYCQAFQNLIELIVYARPLFQCLISA